MASSLFAGDPLKAPSYAATTSDVPQWLQDYTVDLFSQQRAVAGTPYQPYALPRISDVTAPTTAAQNLITSSSGAYQPAMQNAIAGTQGLAGQVAGTTSGLSMLQQAAGMSGAGAAQPYLNAAGQSSVSNIGSYMNPYTQNVTDQIAKLGARNLSENLLPAVSDQFIRAGQFGSSGMGTFGGRALRDTQEAILNQQNQALQSGYTQALGASQADLARQATLGQTAGQLTQAGQQNLGTIGAQTAATAQAEAARQAQTQQQVADLAKMQQGLTTADAAALEAVGNAQQAQTQKGLDVAYQDYQNQINFPQTQINNMSATLRGLPATAVPTTGTQTGYTTQFAPSPLSTIAAAYGTYKGLTTGNAKGGLIDGYAEGGSVAGTEDLYGSVMNDYGQYLTKYYDEKMANAQPAIQQNKNAVANMAAYHAANAPIASPNTVPAMYKQYNTLKSSTNPAAVNETSAAANALQAKYNEQYNALNPSAVAAAADAANAMVKPYSDPATILSAYNSGAYDVGMPKDITPAERRAMIDQYVASGYATVRGPDPTVWYMRPKAVPSTGVLPTAKQAEYDALLNNYNTLNSNYTTGLEKIAPLKTEYETLLAKYNDLNSNYTADTEKLAAQKTAYEKALKASQIPSPFGNSMPRLAHGGMVPGYAEEGYVDAENPADLVDGGQAFADQYAQGQLDYPVQQDAPAAMPVARASGTYPVVGNDTINALVTKYGGLGDDAIRQLSNINTQRTAARNDYNAQIAKLEAMQPQGPSESEKWFKLAAAFSNPGKTGSFFEGMGGAASVLAEHNKAKREYQQEFMKNRIMAGLKRGEFTMEDLARQEKSTVDMAQLGITSQEKLAALMEKINAGEKERLAGISVHFNDANGEIVVADKGTNSVTVLRQADIPENVHLEIMKNATARAESYDPADKPARIAQFMKEGLEAYAKTRVAIKLGTTSDIPPLAPTAAPTGTAPSLSGNTIPLKTGTGQAAPAPTAAAAPAATSAAPGAETASVGYASPFGEFTTAPPRAMLTSGEQTPQQKIEFEGQAAANLDEVKLFNTRVNEASAAGAAGVAAANQLLNVLPQIPNTGTLAPYRQQLGSVFGSLGIQGDITDSANMLSIAQSAVSGSVLGQQLLQKGVQTEGDAKRMEMAGPTLTQPKTAVEFLTRTAKATGLRQLEMSAFRNAWRANPKNVRGDLGMGDAWNAYINATPLTATLPNNKLIFVNEYVDQYMKAHPTGTTEQRRGAALSNWRKLGGM